MQGFTVMASVRLDGNIIMVNSICTETRNRLMIRQLYYCSYVLTSSIKDIN